jgi:hypothetical protein
MREGRPVRGGAQQTRELLKRNTALNEELRRRGGPQEESDVERVLRQRGQAMPDAVDPIAAAAVRESDGKIFTGPLHTNAIEKAIAAGYKDGGYPKSDYGFVTKGGQFLSSEDAREYAITQRQVTRQGLDKWEAELGIDGMPGLESGAFALAKSEAKKFQKFDDNFSKAATRGDLAAAEKINDQAAKELGLRSAVHATSAEPFSQFKIHPEGDVQHGFPAIFFSDSDMGYGRHRGAKGQRRVEKFYIRMERPLDLRKHKSNTDHPDYQKAWERYSKVFEKAVEQGRVTQDSIVLGPLLDELPFDSFILHEAKGFSYAVLDPSQIVSAQPILQNADGSPVLPSQRFASALATKNTIARPATGRTRGQAMPDSDFPIRGFHGGPKGITRLKGSTPWARKKGGSDGVIYISTDQAGAEYYADLRDDGRVYEVSARADNPYFTSDQDLLIDPSQEDVRRLKSLGHDAIFPSDPNSTLRAFFNEDQVRLKPTARGQAMPDVGSFDEDAGAYLIAAGDGESLPVYQQADKRGKPAVDGTGKAKFVPIDYDLLHGPGITKYTGPGPEDATKPNYKGLAYDITQKGQREIDAAIDSGAVDSAANRVVDFTVEAMKNREIAAGKGWYSRMWEKLLSAFGEKDASCLRNCLERPAQKRQLSPTSCRLLMLLRASMRGAMTAIARLTWTCLRLRTATI